VQNEEPLKGQYSNDNKFGRPLVWNRVTDTSLDSKVHFSIKGIERVIFKRVFNLKSLYDMESLKDRWDGMDLLVLHSNQMNSQTLDLVRQLDKSLPHNVCILYLNNPSLLSNFGIVPENYIWTVRFLRRTRESLSNNIDIYSFKPDSGRWSLVCYC